LEGIRDSGNTVRNRLADQRMVSAEYGIDHIHIAGSDELPAIETVSFSNRHSGIDGYAVSTGFGVQFNLGADIAALVKEAAGTPLLYSVKEPSFIGKDNIAVKIKRNQGDSTIGNGNAVNEPFF
jgi:hypothetical protein